MDLIDHFILSHIIPLNSSANQSGTLEVAQWRGKFRLVCLSRKSQSGAEKEKANVQHHIHVCILASLYCDASYDFETQFALN